MKRDLEKYIKEYREQFYHRKDGTGAIYPTDVLQIRDYLVKRGELTDLDAISYGLEAGFMIGYKYGKREAKKK